jgi:homopolymeric O-antigen transport system permease protein
MTSIDMSQESVFKTSALPGGHSAEPGILDHLRDLYAYRELLLMWTVREVRIRYKQSVLGAGWAVLQPLCLMLVFTAVFSYFARVPTGDIPYPIFSYTGLLPWTFLATSISFAVPAMINNMQLISKIYFPREILPLACVIVALIDLLVASLVFAGMVFYYDVSLHASILWVPVLLLFQTMLVLGIVLWLSALMVSYRDLRFVVPLGMQIWMFACPIIYPMSLVPEHLRPIYALNPMASLVTAYREVLLRSGQPDLAQVATAAIISFALLLSGYIYFKNAEAEFADII